MFNLGAAEIGVLLLLGLVLIGPDKMPALVREIGRAYRRLRSGIRDVGAQLREESGLDLDELRSLHPRHFLDIEFDDEESVSRPAPNALRPTSSGVGQERRERAAHD